MSASRDARTPGAPPAPAGPATTIGNDVIEVTRVIAGTSAEDGGAELGRMITRFSLAPEMARFAAARRRIIWLTLAFVVLAAVAIGAISRRLVVTPLSA